MNEYIYSIIWKILKKSLIFDKKNSEEKNREAFVYSSRTDCVHFDLAI